MADRRRRRTRAPRAAAPAQQPRAALDAEQVRARRLALQPALQHRVDLVLDRVRERTSCSRRASRRRRIRQRSSGIHTASSSPRHSKLAKARASSLSVFARALEIPVSSGVTTTTRFTCGSRILATSQQLPVTSNATRSDGSRLSASDLATLRRARHPARRADIAVLADRHHTEVAMHIQANRTTDPSRQSPPHTSTARVDACGRTSGTTTQTDTSSQLNPGKSQGRPNEKPGLEAHRSKRVESPGEFHPRRSQIPA